MGGTPSRGGLDACIPRPQRLMQLQEWLPMAPYRPHTIEVAAWRAQSLFVIFPGLLRLLDIIFLFFSFFGALWQPRNSHPTIDPGRVEKRRIG